jgi:hypothetical protein
MVVVVVVVVGGGLQVQVPFVAAKACSIGTGKPLDVLRERMYGSVVGKGGVRTVVNREGGISHQPGHGQ